MRKVWIEAALNGGWSRALQPGIPDTVEAIIAEGVACARAGATIVHVHAYDGGGPQTHDWQVYARIIEGIRNEVDVPVYPSYPAFTTDGDAGLADVSVRYAHIEALVERGLIEFALIDPGSANFTLTTTTSAAKPAGTYMNPEDHVRYVLDFTARHGLHPDFAIYEPGFMRAGAVLARAAGTKAPIYRFMFCNLHAVGFPPRPYALAGLPVAAGGGSARCALDDRGRQRRYPPLDRRDGQARRPCSRRPRGCAARHKGEQPRTGRRGRAHGARARRRTGYAC